MTGSGFEALLTRPVVRTFKPPFMVKEGFPFVIVPALAGMFFAYFQLWPVAALFALLAGFMAFFFRDPIRQPPQGEGLILASADGRVTRIDETPESKVVSVFMSPLDVHINRSPIECTIEKVAYIHGKKAPATSNSASLTNERNTLFMTGSDGTQITCTQIAGIMARRIVCWNKAGDELARGEKFGLIKFSSRTDVSMPAEAEIRVKLGDHVKGGETVIAYLAPQNTPAAEVNE